MRVADRDRYDRRCAERRSMVVFAARPRVVVDEHECSGPSRDEHVQSETGDPHVRPQ